MTASFATVDAFSGPRGWDVGARAAGLPDALGIEHDADACATSRAAGFPTLQADVAAVPLATYAQATGHIASPPCPTFSPAGKGTGRDDMPVLVDIARQLAARPSEAQPIASIATALTSDGSMPVDDLRTLLCAEPLRWALAALPTWIAWEQVPPVLPFWEVCAEHLTAAGYDVWTGLLRAEQYGVPQTRLRAFLLARRDGEPVRPPAPTHRRYLPPKKHDGGGLFDVADLTERRVHPEDRDLVPWVSMADALGWDAADVVGFPRRAETESNRTGETVTLDGEDYRARDLRTASEPAQVVTEKARSWSRRPAVVRTNNFSAQAREPDGSRAAVGSERYERSTGAPSPTVTGAVRLWHLGWPRERPATTVTCDPRIARPGHHGTGEDGDAERSMTDAVRVTVAQAAALQSFPADHPWQGSRSAQYRQVGNAVPPLLARRVIEAIAGPEIHAARERRAA